MSAAGPSREIADFLTDPATHDGAAVDTIETHGAVVVLAADTAYKLKKPVDLGFFDFTTVEKRRAALQAELDLNAPAAPQIYRRLSWITRGPAGLALDGPGQRIEPVLVMARFDQDALYSHIARAGGLDLVEARKLAAMARKIHGRASVSEDRDGHGRIRRVLDPLIDRLTAAAPDAGCVAAVARNLEAAFGDSRKVLNTRAERGFVRRCHGDLHLNNIVRLNGEPVPFDALEFDEELATVDVLYDLAFLIADLARLGLRAEAAALAGQYLAGEEAGIGAAGAVLLDPFCAVRALVRALASFTRDGEDSEEGRQWLDLAADFARPRPARLVAVGGLSGSGKSTLADALALELGGPAGLWVIKSDVERKAALGLDWNDRIPPDSYTRQAASAVYERQRAKARAALEAGAPVILDAVHLNPEDRDAVVELARLTANPFIGIWLDADRKILRDRVAARTNDPSDADIAVVDKQTAWDPGEITWPRLDASRGREAVLDAALRLVSDHSPGR
ncbi:bifunctional aminoglycoside phosphotransferase/ATP-binding protein [Maricaulaceae bacterium MS644]